MAGSAPADGDASRSRPPLADAQPMFAHRERAVAAQPRGLDVANRVGPIWNFGEDQELRNMFTRTPQPGLWFIAGSFAQCRIYSKYLGLQIKASELGILPPVG